MIDDEDALRIKGRVCIPCIDDLVKIILTMAHSLRNSIYYGAIKMYRNKRQHYWWGKMKCISVEFVIQYLNCQQVKYEHQIFEGMLQKMSILT